MWGEIPRAVSDQETFHLLMVVMTHHDNHKTWRGQLMGLTNSIYLDDLIKYTRPLRCDTDKNRETINGSIQYLE